MKIIRIIIVLFICTIIHVETHFLHFAAVKYHLSGLNIWQLVSCIIVPTLVLLCAFLAKNLKKHYAIGFCVLVYVVPGIAILNAITCFVYSIIRAL